MKGQAAFLFVLLLITPVAAAAEDLPDAAARGCGYSDGRASTAHNPTVHNWCPKDLIAAGWMRADQLDRAGPDMWTFAELWQKDSQSMLCVDYFVGVSNGEPFPHGNSCSFIEPTTSIKVYYDKKRQSK